MPALRPTTPFSCGPTTDCAPGPIRWQAMHFLKTVAPLSGSPSDCATAPGGPARPIEPPVRQRRAILDFMTLFPRIMARHADGGRAELGYHIGENGAPGQMTAIAMPPVDAGDRRPPRRDRAPASRPSSARTHVIVAEDERRAYETDALTAYRAVPLAVVLPGSTEEVVGGPRVPRRRAASRSSPAAPARRSPAARCRREDAVVVGLARLNRILVDRLRQPHRARSRPASPTSTSPTPSPTAASSTRPIRRASSPAPSPATSP